MSRREELRRRRDEKLRAKFTVDEASASSAEPQGTVVEVEVPSAQAVPGWGEADIPEGLTVEAMLARSLDIALGLLYHERVMMLKDLADSVVEAWKVQANYTYEEFRQATECDPRFQVLHGQIIALAEEPDPLGLLLERIERDSHEWR